MRYAAAAIRRRPVSSSSLLAAPQSAPAQETSLAGWRPPDLVDAVASLGAVGARRRALRLRRPRRPRARPFHGEHQPRVPAAGPGTRAHVGRAGARPSPARHRAGVRRRRALPHRRDDRRQRHRRPSRQVLHSTRSVARYSVAADRWEPLPDLPVGRSSHDAVITGGVLYVVGGWELRGPDEDAVWADSVLALDLQGGTAWREIPAPFKTAGAGGRNRRRVRLRARRPAPG